MTQEFPQNIVEAYTLASQAADLNPKTKLQEFAKVIAFCEDDKQCSAENSLKRNTLLFWAYDNVAKIRLEEHKYEEALAIWLKSRNLLKSPQAKIRLGNKMLDAVNQGHFSISEKAGRIVEIALFLQKAYEDVGEKDNAQRMQRLVDAAGYLLPKSNNPN